MFRPFVLLGLILGMTTHVSAAPETGKGSIELSYAPKYCVMEPCPQFDVISVNRKQAAKGIGAILENIDEQKSTISDFRRIVVKGTWKVDPENASVLRIQVKEWHALVGEKITEKKPPTKSESSKQD